MLERNRRRFVQGAGALALAGRLPAAFAQPGKAAPITVVINQSPWFGGFRQLVEQYEKETGNRIQLDVNPYAGSLEKIRVGCRWGSGSERVKREGEAGSGYGVAGGKSEERET